VRATLPAAALALVLAGCSREPDTPEARVRALVAQAEKWAEERDAGELKGLLSERFAAAGGQDREEIGGLLAYTFLRHRSVHLLVRVHALEIPEPGRAELTAFVAMAGSPILGPAALSGLRADLHRFDLRLAEESGEWRVTWAEWRPAKLDDFL
jgi:hypothetical protein